VRRRRFWDMQVAYPTRMGSVALEPFAGLAYVRQQ
jgi:uncharacterized protein with beta-barrel porin domain